MPFVTEAGKRAPPSIGRLDLEHQLPARDFDERDADRDLEPVRRRRGVADVDVRADRVLARPIEIRIDGTDAPIARAGRNSSFQFKGKTEETKVIAAKLVKLIGATAHFITDDLDEGPIIEQDVSRVGYAMNAKEFAAHGRDLESLVLARAVNWFVLHRILLNGDRTIVFR